MATKKRKVPTPNEVEKKGTFKDRMGIKDPAPKKRNQGFEPTDEQVAAIDLFSGGKSFAIEAGAGTGKTSTLLFLADNQVRGTAEHGQYVAFNKSIVTEASTKFGRNVACNTAHSLAFRAVGKKFAHRLNSNRMRSSELAARLHLSSVQFNVGGSPKTLQPAYLASLVMRSLDRFCQTADPHPKTSHVPYIDGIDMPDEYGRRQYDNNDEVREMLYDAILAAWEDIQQVNGQLPFKHGHYLKLWQLGDPVIGADYILFDEVQDADPVMADVVQKQDCQIVLVGDSQQEIYGWRGAVNAFGLFSLPDVTYLTQSFRFGDAVAEVANKILAGLDTPLRLKGLPSIQSKVGPISNPTAILSRTNATAVRAVLELQKEQTPVALIGGGKDTLAFARAANDLRMRGFTGHPELACFNSWDEVGEYVANDPQGSDLKLQYDLVNEFGVEAIEEALGTMGREEDPGVVVVSTAHKAKGREWSRVQLAPDFAPKEDKLSGGEMPQSPEEQRLLYVAVTRARDELDISAVPQLMRK